MKAYSKQNFELIELRQFPDSRRGRRSRISWKTVLKRNYRAKIKANLDKVRQKYNGKISKSNFSSFVQYKKIITDGVAIYGKPGYILDNEEVTMEEYYGSN